MTPEQLRDLLQGLVTDYGSQRELARRLLVSPQYLNDVLMGRREPGPAMLRGLGLERTVTYTEANR